MSSPPIIQASRLSIGYASGQVAGPLHLALQAGEFVCLLGSNGSGKSTLLRTLAGLQPALGGELLLQGRPAGKTGPAGIAKIISLVLTDRLVSGNLDVYTLIALGRYPHTGWFGTLDENDKKIIQQAIAAAGVEKFVERKFDRLSDGEAQKVMLARALAQDTPLIMLDEPTAHVDLPGRIRLMKLLHGLSRERGKAIVISTHELDLALQVADRIWLLLADGTLQSGTPEDLVLNGTFEAAFNRQGLVFDRATGRFPVHTLFQKGAVRLTGTGAPLFWTKRALQRMGYNAEAHHADACEVEVYEEGGRIGWVYGQGKETKRCDTIEELLHVLEQAVKQR